MNPKRNVIRETRLKLPPVHRPNQRLFSRSEVEVHLQFLIPETQNIATARLYNFCQNGVHFQSDMSMEPGQETTIVIPDVIAEAPAVDSCSGYRIQVRWCKQLQKQKSPSFGIGAQLLEKTDVFLKTATPERFYVECDLCGRVLNEWCACRISGAVCLCLACYKHLQTALSGSLHKSVLRFIERNVV
jgi:hypothetical protein